MLKRFVGLMVMVSMLAVMAWDGVLMASEVSQLQGITGKIGNEDIYWGTGAAADTFSVPTYSGGTLTLTKIPSLSDNITSIIKGSWYISGSNSVSDNSDADQNGSLAWVLAQIGSDPGHVVLLPGSYAVGDDLSIPANIRLTIRDGAYLEIESGKTVTFSTPENIEVSNNQRIFSGAGTVAFTYPGIVYANWWGAKGDRTDAAGTTTAIQAAITAVTPAPGALYYGDRTTHAGTVKLACGHYLIDQPLVVTTDVVGFSLEGDCGAMHGFGTTTIQWAGATMSDSDDWMLDVGSVKGFRLSKIYLLGVADDDDATARTIQNGVFVRRVGDFYASGNVWEDVTIRKFPGIGVQFGDYTATDGGEGVESTNTDNSYIKNLFIENCRTGMVIDSPNFLQVHFSRLVITNYGGNPVDDEGVPVESSSATPIKFRTKNAVRVLHGELQAVDSTFLASYFDDDIESQYAIYVAKGSVNIQGGYSETRFLAYFDDDNTSIMNVNSISNYHLYPGSAGGPDDEDKYPIVYKQTQVPLVLTATKDINVYEDLASAGVQTFGCRSQQPVISWTAKTSTNYQRNPKSNDWGSITMTPDSGLRWDANNMFGALGRIGSEENGQIVISTNLVKRTTSTSHCYLFVPNDADNNETHGVIIDGDGLQTFMTNDLTPGACYTLDFIRASSSDKVYPALQGTWAYDDATRKAGYRYLPDRRAFQLFGAVSGGTGVIFYTPARMGAGTVYRIATTANRAYAGLYVDQNGGLYHEDGNTTSVSLDGIVLMTD